MTDRPCDSLSVGMKVAISLSPGVAPIDAYAGDIQAIDEHGIRITLMDWVIGAFLGSDLFIPWRNLQAAMVFTEEHDLSRFAEAAANWQSAMQGE